ncbi:hypothetical protein Tco_0293024, partial [Tanacetum coccineum]
MIREEAPQEEGNMDVTEQIIVNPSFLDQMVTIGGRLSKGCKEQLRTLLESNMEVFAWEPADMTGLATVPFHNLTKEILVEVLNERSTEVQEVQAIVEEEGDNWMTPIIKYLEEGIIPSDSNEARALRAKIGQYTMESGVLFKKGYLIPMLRCVGP